MNRQEEVREKRYVKCVDLRNMYADHTMIAEAHKKIETNGT